MEYAMSLSKAQTYGIQFAAYGWNEAHIGDWLVENGYKVNGATAQRILKAYTEQKRREAL